ncbi:MAG TPA: DUF1003 domain-containing protein [Candidatus Saccharimonadales bacterium]
MNKFAEKLAEIFGSGPFIIFHVIWFATWIILNSFLQFDQEYSILTIVVSLEAIFLSLFILRAENIQSARLERKVKEDVRKTKADKKNTEKVLKEVRKSTRSRK